MSATDLSLPYWLSADWTFLDSIEGYDGCCETYRERRRANPPLDARAVLYGRPLFEFISREYFDTGKNSVELLDDEALAAEISAVHARWLMTPRDDLRGQSPREVLLARQGLIDLDSDMRERQWSLQGAPPPVLSSDSFAYRFGGFGTHEWVLYYELVRHLLGNIWGTRVSTSERPLDMETVINHLEHLKTAWLDEPQPDFSFRIPAELIDKERKRLPVAVSASEVLIDEDCYTCQMESRDVELGISVVFMHLDGGNMDDDFAFSHFLSYEEWQADRREWEKDLDLE